MKIIIMCILFISTVQLFAVRLRIDPRDEFAKISYEHMWDLPVDSTFTGSDPRLNNVWLYAGLPGIRIGPRYMFSSVEADVVVRSFSVDSSSAGGSVMQRYGLFLGYPLFKGENHTGAFMIGTGIASDMSEVNENDFYLNLIYDHRFVLSGELTLGMGILVSHNLGRFKRPPINFLPTVRWKPNDFFLFHAGWDHLSLKLYPWQVLAFVSETRYDLSYFNLEEYSYQFENVSTGGGVDLALGKNFSVKIRLFKSLYYREDSWNRSEDITITSYGKSAGMSFRTELVYLR